MRLVEPPERGDHLLANRSAFAPALDDLQIGAAAGGLLAEIHGGEPDANSIEVRTEPTRDPEKSSTIGRKRGTTPSRPRTLASNHINALHPPGMLQLSISLNSRRHSYHRALQCPSLALQTQGNRVKEVRDKGLKC